MILTMGVGTMGTLLPWALPGCSLAAPWPSFPCPSYLCTNSNSRSTATSSRIHMNPSVSNYFPQSQPFSVKVRSPKARLTDHHKQYFSFLAHTNFILNKSDITNSRYSLTLLLLAVCVSSKESLFIPAAISDNFEPILLIRSVDQHQK